MRVAFSQHFPNIYKAAVPPIGLHSALPWVSS